MSDERRQRENGWRPGGLFGSWLLPWRIRLPVYASAGLVAFGVLSIFLKDSTAFLLAVFAAIITTYIVGYTWLARQRSGDPRHH